MKNDCKVNIERVEMIRLLFVEQFTLIKYIVLSWWVGVEKSEMHAYESIYGTVQLVPKWLLCT